MVQDLVIYVKVGAMEAPHYSIREFFIAAGPTQGKYCALQVTTHFVTVTGRDHVGEVDRHVLNRTPVYKIASSLIVILYKRLEPLPLLLARPFRQ